MHDKNLKGLYLLAENERAAARLYKSFETKSAEHGDFWGELAKEELQHAEWIEELKPGAEEGTVRINKEEFPIEMLEGSIETINAIAERAENNKQSLSEYCDQLEVAHELEKGMIEKKFFKAFDTDNDLVKSILEKLQDATLDHQRRVEKEWNKNK